MNNNWLDTQLLEDYLDGKLDAKAMHFVERNALDDPFVAEALEGLGHARNRKQVISSLQRQLHERVAQQPVKRKLWGIGTQRISIAAAAAVTFISASLIYWMMQNEKWDAQQQAGKKVEVILSPKSGVQRQQSGVQGPGSAVVLPPLNEADKTDVVAAAPTIARNAVKVPVQPKVSARYSISADAGGFSATTMQAAPVAEAVAAPLAMAKMATPFPGKITGTIMSSESEPVAGAAIRSASGKSLGVSDEQGKFVVDSAAAGSGLTVAYLGMVAQTKAIPASKVVNFQMVRDDQTLSTVVVTGMGRSTQAAAVGYSVGSVPAPIGDGYSGVVQSLENAKPIPNAKLLRVSDGKVFTADDKGHFKIIRLTSEEKKADFKVSTAGFKEQTVTLEIGKISFVKL